MPPLNAAAVEKILPALASLPEDAKPNWGKMNRDQLFGHLNMAVRYTLGEGPEMPFKGNAKTKYLFRPLAVNGLVRLPRNVRLPKPKGMKEMPPPPEASCEELGATLRDYVARLEQGGLPARTHPFFGVLNQHGWSKFHWNHFRHHLEQFGVWPE